MLSSLVLPVAHSASSEIHSRSSRTHPCPPHQDDYFAAKFSNLDRFYRPTRLFAATLAMLSIPFLASAGTVTYTSTQQVISNPERGPWRWTYLDGSTNYSSSGLDTPELTLVYANLDLSPYTSTPNLPQSKLNDITTAFNNLRSNGVKCILRPVYNQQSGNSFSDASSVSIITGHLTQLKSLFQSNNDAIAFVQAGSMGRWAEWHDPSVAALDTLSNHNNILQSLLSNTSSESFVLLRRPCYKTDNVGITGYDSTGATPLNQLNAFQGTNLSRLGFYNDGFLNGTTNDGTYAVWTGAVNLPGQTATTWRNIAINESLYVPYGGETDALYTDIVSAEAEMAAVHFTFLDKDYYTDTLNSWKANTTEWNNIRRNLGYRFELVSATLPDSVAPGQPFNVSVQIKNVGYAPLYARRPVYIRMFDKATGAILIDYDLSSVADPRRWAPSANPYAINSGTLIAPANLTAANVGLALWMPEKDNTHNLRADARYSVRIPSYYNGTTNDVWRTGGWNELTNGNIPVVSASNGVRVAGGALDWYGVTPIISDLNYDAPYTAAADVTYVQARNDSSYLYLRVQSTHAWNFAGTDKCGILIDTNNNTASGYTPGGGAAVGAEINVQGSNIYDTRNGWSSSLCNGSATVTPSGTQGDVEFRIPLSATFPDGSRVFPSTIAGSIIHVKLYSDNATDYNTVEWAPDFSTAPGVYTLVGSDSVSGGAINWWGIPSVINEAGNDAPAGAAADYTTVQATNDGTYLYLRVKSTVGCSFSSSDKVGILVDANNNTSSGYNPSGYPTSIGAEIHVQGANIYDTHAGWTANLCTGNSTVTPTGSQTDVEVRIPFSTNYPSAGGRVFPSVPSGNVLHLKLYSDNQSDYNTVEWAPNLSLSPGSYTIK